MHSAVYFRGVALHNVERRGTQSSVHSVVASNAMLFAIGKRGQSSVSIHVQVSRQVIGHDRRYRG